MAHFKLKDMSDDDLEALINRVQDAVDHNKEVSADDTRLLLEILKGYLYIQERLARKDITMRKLRRLLGIESSSEKTDMILGKNNTGDADTKSDSGDIDENTSADKEAKGGHGRSGQENFPKAKEEHHALTDIHKGDLCPHCGKGKVYKFEPRQFIRITGHAPLQAMIHISEQVRCNHCQKVITATLPQAVLDDGGDRRRFGYSATALVTLMKYGLGMPFFRQHTLQEFLKTPISTSTLWDLVEEAANVYKPVWEVLRRMAAGGKVFMSDDTTHRILSAEAKLKKIRGSDKERLRTGVHTSGIISILDDDKKISLFKTGINHAGEFIDEILALRPDLKKPYLHMSDALSSNTPKIGLCHKLFCNSHARRAFIDIERDFPDEVREVLLTYQQVYQIEAEIKAQKKTPEERLAIHYEQSLPLMEALFKNLNKKVEDKLIEPNSLLGEAVSYLTKNWEGLIGFTKYVGAPLDNNAQERTLKRIILHRKNSLFFKNEIGSAVADIHMSLIITAQSHNCQILDYLRDLLRYRDQVKANPEKFLPWNYEATISEIQQTTL